jgi:hypothetical protein
LFDEQIGEIVSIEFGAGEIKWIITEDEIGIVEG